MIKIDKLHSDIRKTLESKNYGWITPNNIDSAVNQSMQAIIRESMDELSILKGKDSNVRYTVDVERIEYLDNLLYNFYIYDEVLTYNSTLKVFTFVNKPIVIKNIWFTEDSEIEIVSPSVFKRDRLNGASCVDFPEAKKINNITIKIHPEEVIADVTADYIKEAVAPLWTYITVSGKSVFSRNSQTVDVDLPATELDNLITKTIELLSISLRNPTIQQVEAQKDLADRQFKNNN